MDRNTKFAVPVSPEHHGRITEREIFIAKVKLAGWMILAIIDLIVIVWKGLPP